MMNRALAAQPITFKKDPVFETPAVWSLDLLAGRLVEISGLGATALLTVGFDLVLQAQLEGKPCAWITLSTSSFFPPDAACSGVDLEALPVVRVGNASAAARAADKLVRSGAFALVIVDLAGPEAHATALRSLNSKSTAEVPMPLQSRLLGLARRYHTAVVFLTNKDERSPSLGPLIGIRAEVRRQSKGDGAFTCEIRVIKDKREGPGRLHRQHYHAPAGLR
ncbi:MAG: recombinase A [Candidatus Dadabacteria bacterium]|nr:MAG: recombinase A [Candidatus Dadabacteria bacterium]